MIKSKKLSKNKAIKHGFFNSNGGVSKNIYKSLNCGPGSNDNGANVKINLNIVRKKISKSSQNIFLLVPSSLMRLKEREQMSTST